jgi:UDP-glucuronate decarboxylase
MAHARHAWIVAARGGAVKGMPAFPYTCRMPRSLVTGGAGFLGSHLCDSLLASGHEVTCIDNLFTGSRRTIRHLEGTRGFRFVEHDVTEPFDVGCDFIWNLACPAAPGHYRYDPVKTMMTSVLGVHHCLELARRTGARVLHASTSEVYGDPHVHPQPESYRGNVNPIGPRACYDEGKRAAETLCFDHRRMHGTSIKVVRIFNTYGPRMHPYDGRVVSNFIRQSVMGEPMTVFGDGTQTRSFCYVDDLVAGFRLLMDSPEAFTGPVNMGNPYEFTMIELAREVARVVGADARIEHRPLPQDDPMQRQPDIALARAELGWEPRVQLAEGIARTVEWFRSINPAEYPAPTPNVMQPEAQAR